MAASVQADAVRRAVETLDHPSADEVFMHVRQSHAKVSLGTVYRNLDRLVREGQLRVREIGGQRRYDDHLEPHAHLHCMECDRLLDVPWDAAGLTALQESAQEHGFQVHDHLLELQGMCKQCQDSTRASTQ